MKFVFKNDEFNTNMQLGLAAEVQLVASLPDELVSCIQNDEDCIKKDEYCIKTDVFCVK